MHGASRRYSGGQPPTIYLASSSQQRRAILKEIGVTFKALDVNVNEIVGANARDTVVENAARKLRAGLRKVLAQSIVIAADTVLEVKGEVLGKPDSRRTAIKYLKKLSGKTALAYSGVCVMSKDGLSGIIATETAEVQFKPLTDATIQWYVSTNEPMGRAGAFGIGLLGEVLTRSAMGCYSCVAGLPKTALLAALARFGAGRYFAPIFSMPDELIGPRVRLDSFSLENKIENREIKKKGNI